MKKDEDIWIPRIKHYSFINYVEQMSTKISERECIYMAWQQSCKKVGRIFVNEIRYMDSKNQTLQKPNTTVSSIMLNQCSQRC